MALVLTGDMIGAEQAERDGLVCRVVPRAELLTEALKMADKISSFSRPAVAMAKETVNASQVLSARACSSLLVLRVLKAPAPESNLLLEMAYCI